MVVFIFLVSIWSEYLNSGYYVGGSNVVVISENDADIDIVFISVKPLLQLSLWYMYSFKATKFSSVAFLYFLATRRCTYYMLHAVLFLFLCDSTLSSLSPCLLVDQLLFVGWEVC